MINWLPARCEYEQKSSHVWQGKWTVFTGQAAITMSLSSLFLSNRVRGF